MAAQRTMREQGKPRPVTPQRCASSTAPKEAQPGVLQAFWQPRAHLVQVDKLLASNTLDQHATTGQTDMPRTSAQMCSTPSSCHGRTLGYDVSMQAHVVQPPCGTEHACVDDKHHAPSCLAQVVPQYHATSS
jgi:hypothetical protein